MGPPVDSVQLPKLSGEKTMVYGRYNYSYWGLYRIVYKPTYNYGAPSCNKSNNKHD